ncbi:MAG: response regulator transcription factor [Deltaproteobacteria bacterium]|nr:response regulator transcription factor [Deltaproteobacteria bacterium]
MHVLVVDDSSTIRHEVGRALTGFSCDFAENGLVALRLALARRYDLILTDLTMPLLDGLKFIGRIRSGGKNQETPILILSSRKDEEAVFGARDLGVQGYILKPFAPEDLLGRVRAALSRSGGAAE